MSPESGPLRGSTLLRLSGTAFRNETQPPPLRRRPHPATRGFHSAERRLRGAALSARVGEADEDGVDEPLLGSAPDVNLEPECYTDPTAADAPGTCARHGRAPARPGPHKRPTPTPSLPRGT